MTQLSKARKSLFSGHRMSFNLAHAGPLDGAAHNPTPRWQAVDKLWISCAHVVYKLGMRIA